jgi:hypothetical protein
MKEEALKLADKLEGLNSCEPVIIKACEDMIRKLVAKIEVTERDYNFMYSYAIGLENSIKEFCATAKSIDKGEYPK